MPIRSRSGSKFSSSCGVATAATSTANDDVTNYYHATAINGNGNDAAANDDAIAHDDAVAHDDATAHDDESALTAANVKAPAAKTIG